jgi:hypothetical protein
MTKAIFNIYENGKFVLGAWVKSDGGVRDNSIFPYVMEETDISTDRNLKYSFYKTINNYITERNFRSMFGDKKNPFRNQFDSEGMKSVDVLFWENKLSDKQLLKNYLWGEYTYEIRFTKKSLKVKVNYSGQSREWVNNNADQHEDFIDKMLDEVEVWVDNIDFGLNDCDCDKEKLLVV